VKEIHSAFDAAGICYWVADGTLLGLYRHSALLPWDHDADINILAPDYKAALAVRHLFTENFPACFWLFFFFLFKPKIPK